MGLPRKAKSRLRTKPKRYFADPSIPAAALGMGPERLLSDGQAFGLLFESLCVHDLRAYTACLPGASRIASLLRDSDGWSRRRHRASRRSLGSAGDQTRRGQVPDGIKNIERLREKVASNPAARNPKPEFCAVVTATSPFCRYDAAHDVYVFPITALRQ